MTPDEVVALLGLIARLTLERNAAFAEVARLRKEAEAKPEEPA